MKWIIIIAALMVSCVVYVVMRGETKEWRKFRDKEFFNENVTTC